MNARAILDDELRKAVAHMSLQEIREFHAQLERDALQLRIFLKLSAGKKPASPSRRFSRDGWRGQSLN
jgi:hypothetical protein